MSDRPGDFRFSDGEHHVWYDLSQGYGDALTWLQNDPSASWTAMFYQLHEPDILHVIGSHAAADLMSQPWAMERLYLRFRSRRDAAMFKLRFNAVTVQPQLPHQYAARCR